MYFKGFVRAVENVRNNAATISTGDNEALVKFDVAARSGTYISQFFVQDS
jgi:hypothetical protein